MLKTVVSMVLLTVTNAYCVFERLEAPFTDLIQLPAPLRERLAATDLVDRIGAILDALRSSDPAEIAQGTKALRCLIRENPAHVPEHVAMGFPDHASEDVIETLSERLSADLFLSVALSGIATELTGFAADDPRILATLSAASNALGTNDVPSDAGWGPRLARVAEALIANSGADKNEWNMFTAASYLMLARNTVAMDIELLKIGLLALIQGDNATYATIAVAWGLAAFPVEDRALDTALMRQLRSGKPSLELAAAAGVLTRPASTEDHRSAKSVLLRRLGHLKYPTSYDDVQHMARSAMRHLFFFDHPEDMPGRVIGEDITELSISSINLMREIILPHRATIEGRLSGFVERRRFAAALKRFKDYDKNMVAVARTLGHADVNIIDVTTCERALTDGEDSD